MVDIRRSLIAATRPATGADKFAIQSDWLVVGGIAAPLREMAGAGLLTLIARLIRD
jgi:hypothetical protein